jgi:hypothetical protein
MKAFHLGDTLVRHISAPLAHMHSEALRITRILGQPVKMFYMHTVTPWTTTPAAFERQVDSPSGNREIAYAKSLLVIKTPAAMSTVQTNGCFFRRLSWMTRAYRSPNTPTNFDEAVKPGKLKRARID